MRLAVTPFFASQPHYEYFTLNVKLCEIDSFAVANPTPSTYYYDIKIPATTVDIALPFISVNPSTCTNGYLGIGLDYKLQLASTNIQPAFLTKAINKFTLSTSDASKRGSWSVEMVVYPNAQSS